MRWSRVALYSLYAVVAILAITIGIAFTMDFGRFAPRSIMQRLHGEDGVAGPGGPSFERFRLIAEAPPGAAPLGAALGLAPSGQAVPYKLFEIVPGAVLEAHAVP